MINYPYEGDKHLATIIMVPYRKDIWLNGGKDAINAIYEMAKVITKYEKLILITHPSMYDYVLNLFNFNNLEIIKMEYNDAWARDICPLFIKENNKIKCLGFNFNAWGGEVDGLYSDYSLDVLVKEKLAKYLNLEIKKVNMILEGGSINTNGKGVLLTTKACLLSKGRNPNLNQNEIENILKKELNQKEIIWLDNGIVDDETNEHVDNMACFLDEKTIALAWSEEGLQHNYSLNAYNKLIQLGYKVIKIPVPSPDLILTQAEDMQILKEEKAKIREENNKLAASYINFYQSDKYILLPKFNVKEDEIAYNILKEFYKSKKEIYQIESRSILVSGGNIHCITMQIPEV